MDAAGRRERRRQHGSQGLGSRCRIVEVSVRNWTQIPCRLTISQIQTEDIGPAQTLYLLLVSFCFPLVPSEANCSLAAQRKSRSDSKGSIYHARMYIPHPPWPQQRLSMPSARVTSRRSPPTKYALACIPSAAYSSDVLGDSATHDMAMPSIRVAPLTWWACEREGSQDREVRQVAAHAEIGRATRCNVIVAMWRVADVRVYCV